MKRHLFPILLILATGCSSLPEGQPRSSESVRIARDEMLKGIRFDVRGENQVAVRHFETAYGLFTQVDDLKGKIRSSLAVARQYLLLKDPERAETWMTNAGNLVSVYHPELASGLLLIRTEQLFLAGNPDSVLKLEPKNIKASPEITGQIWAYRLLSRDRLRQDFEDERDELESAVEDMADLAEDQPLDDPYALSYCAYLTGWAYYATAEYKKALPFYELAYQEDQKLENLRGLADDVLGIAQTHEKLGKPDLALSGYFRASEMFRQLSRVSDAEDAEFRYHRLRLPEAGAREKLESLFRSSQSENLKFEIRQTLDSPAQDPGK